METTEIPSEAPSCLLLHGLGGGPYELGPILDRLMAEGLRVLAPVLPGHEDLGPIMPPSSWRDWVATAESAFDSLAEHGPVVVVGFSTGATIALYLATRRPVARMALLAPFLAIRYSGLIPLRPATYLRPLARILPNLPRRPPAARDPETRRSAAASSKLKTFNVSAALSVLELIETVVPLVPTITTPTLIIQGKRDTVVEPSKAAWLHANLRSTEKALSIMPRSEHLVALDYDREQVLAQVLAFALDPQGKGPVP